MQSVALEIRFIGVSDATAAAYSEELRRAIQGESKGVQVDRVREHREAMDLGSSLVLLGEHATVIAVVEVIWKFLEARRHAKLRIAHQQDSHVLELEAETPEGAKLLRRFIEIQKE